MTIPPQAGAGQWIEPAGGSPVAEGAWAFFDRIYCISLRSRQDRRDAVAAEFAKVGLGDRVTFFLADKHPINSEQGIYESHQACLRAGLAAGAERIAVFEDDVFFSRFKPDRLREAVTFLQASSMENNAPSESPRRRKRLAAAVGVGGSLAPSREDRENPTGVDWQAFFLGCYVRSSASTTCRAVRSIRYRSTAHAYVVTRAFAERLVSLPWNGVAWDVQLRQIDDGRYYVMCPCIAFQSNSATDNDQRQRLDRYRRLFGGMAFGQRWDEFSHRRWRSMIVMHILSILLIIAIVMWLRS